MGTKDEDTGNKDSHVHGNVEDAQLLQCSYLLLGLDSMSHVYLTDVIRVNCDTEDVHVYITASVGNEILHRFFCTNRHGIRDSFGYHA